MSIYRNDLQANTLIPKVVMKIVVKECMNYKLIKEL